MHCAHVLCPWVPITYFFFFPFCIFLGRIVLYVTSAQYYGVLQKVTRRRRICEWTPWCVPAHRSEGGGTAADASRGPAPLPLPVTIPASRWMGVSKISALSPLQGSNQILQLPVLFKSWKHVSPIWWSCMIFFPLVFCGVCPLFFFYPASAKTMEVELEMIRSGLSLNCM